MRNRELSSSKQGSGAAPLAITTRAKGGRVAPLVQLTPGERAILERRAEDGSKPPQTRIRARAVLYAAAGASDRQIAFHFGIDPSTVGQWRKRFLEEGIGGIEEKPRRSGPRLSPEKVLQIVRKTKSEHPRNSERWTLTEMAQAASVSPGSVARIWRNYGLTPRIPPPHQTVQPVEAIVGVYLRPPECAIALQVARSNPKPEEPDPSPSSDGLFPRFVEAEKAAQMLRCVWKTLEGHGTGGSEPHRVGSWLLFLRLIDYASDANSGIHLLADGCGVHRHEVVARWMQDHPRLYVEFAAPHRPWFDWVEERFSSAAYANTILQDLEDLASAAAATISIPPSPHPFLWIAKAAEILERAQRRRDGHSGVG